MLSINLLLSDNPNFKFVQVVFPTSSKVYTYKTLEAVEVDDYVVVDTPTEGFKVVKVVRVVDPGETELSFNYQIKWVVSVVNTEKYEEYQKREREINKSINEDELGLEAANNIKGLVRP